jgi:hypothetical protein
MEEGQLGLEKYWGEEAKWEGQGRRTQGRSIPEF